MEKIEKNHRKKLKKPQEKIEKNLLEKMKKTLDRKKVMWYSIGSSEENSRPLKTEQQQQRR